MIRKPVSEIRKTAKETDEMKFESVLQVATDLKLKALENDDKRDIEDMFIDDDNLFFDDENIEDENLF